MSSAERMRKLLSPLEVYRWEGSFQWAELKSAGEALDACMAQLEEIQREMNLETAQGLGLQRIAALLAKSPAATTPQDMRRALAALLRIQDHSFTLEAINDNLSGCGLVAQAVELEKADHIGVVFPEVPGIPKNFPEAKQIIEDILPCHLQIEYLFWYITWRELEEKLSSWKEIENRNLTWAELEAFVK